MEMLETTQVEKQLSDLAATVDLFASKDAIRDCIFRINRGLDRGDERLMLSGFHPDADLCWGSSDAVPLSQWIEIARHVLNEVARVQHLIGNILIEIDGDVANVESYEIAHLTSGTNDLSESIMASRYVDKFERRDGEWRVRQRTKVTDWVRTLEAPVDLWGRSPLRATRDERDASVQAFGPEPFYPMDR
jgi:hypothetical protein